MPAMQLRMTIARSAVLSLLALGVGSPAWPQDLQVAPRTDPVIIGQDLVLDLLLSPQTGVEAGALAVQVDIAGHQLDALLEEPLPLRAGDRPGRFVWIAPTRPDAPPGRYSLSVAVRGPSAEYRWQGDVVFAFGAEWTAGRIGHFIEERGLFIFLALVFLGGVLMSFTPCIYPMIPITLAVLGAQAQDRGMVRSFVTALTYGLGLSLVFGVIGVISALFFGGIIAFLQSPVVLVPIALLMVLLSFAMFGAYELEAPAFLRNRLQSSGSNRAGLVGALVAGMIAGLVASPCVGPFLGGLLLWVGATGSIALGFWALFTFGLGLSALLVAVGTFPAFLARLPRSGGWMETVKKGMGLLLLYMAFYFVRPPLVLPETAFYLLLGAVTIIVAVFLGAFDGLAPGDRWWPRSRKGLGLLAFLTGVWLLARVTVPAVLLQVGPGTMPVSRPAPGIPAAEIADAAPSLPESVQWEVVRTGEGVMAFIEARIADARATGRPIIIDFWATWCAYCRKLDREVWNVPEVVAESMRYIAIKIDATRPDDTDMTAVKELFRVPGLPTVAFIDSSGRILHGRTLSGWHESPVFLEVMRAID